MSRANELSAISDQVLDILSEHNLTTKELVGIFADLLINIGISKTKAPELIAFNDLLQYITDYKQQHGETIETAIIAQGLTMLAWYNKDLEEPK